MGTATPPRGSGIAEALRTARKELLDLGLRNPLLNYRLLRSKGLEVTDESPVEVFRLLVREGKPFTFLPSGEEEETEADEQESLGQPEEDGAVPDRHKDLRLQSALVSKHLQNRLLATYYAARSSIEEQGVNTLYLALGMLRWQDVESADRFCRAPLVLIPVELERSNARERFRLKYNGDELGENVSLSEMLKQKFGITFPELPDAEDLDIASYFDAVEQATASRQKWSVERSAIVLGFFSFAKFLMYRDLDAATWPEEARLPEHPILRALLGEESLSNHGSPYSEGDFIDDRLKDREVRHVVDADSTQTLALLDAADGRNLVIQGPPGTGKSQTIVNMIAEAVGSGKKVLFVSEKMAALEVVKRRLDAVKLGAACLELHSNKINKKTVIEELRRTAQAQAIPVRNADGRLSLLAELRNQLNEYCSAVNTAVRGSGETPRGAYGKLLPIQERLCGCTAAVLEIPEAAEWTAEESVRRRARVEQLETSVSRAGTPAKHPFWGSGLTVFLPTDRERLGAVLEKAACAAEALAKAALDATAKLQAPAPGLTKKEIGLALATLGRLREAPAREGQDPALPAWSERAEEIGRAIEAGTRAQELHRQYDGTLRKEAWGRDVASIRRDLAETGGKWYRFLSGRWRAARAATAGLCEGPAPKDLETQLALLDAIAAEAEATREVQAHETLLGTVFAGHWKGFASDWALLGQQFAWTRYAQRAVREKTVLPWCLRRVDSRAEQEEIGRLQETLQRTWDAYEVSYQQWIAAFKMTEPTNDERSLSALAGRWRGLSGAIDRLQELVVFNQAAEQCSADGLGAVVAVAETWPDAGTHLTDLFERARLSALLTAAFTERPALARFDGAQHKDAIEKFRQLDRLQLEYNKHALAAQHLGAVPAGNGNGQLGVLWKEFEKRGRFLPIRKLMLRAGNAIQAIKPVFMMSPLSIANFLPPGALDFDVVIFDEASQVKPVDALGAVARGRQAVVVGDSRQLPPTSFFDALTGDGEEEEEETATSDIESILGLFCSRGAPQRMLRWHYRSRHESLITVSNHLFYDDRLVVFPSPDQERRQLGLVYRRLQDAPYDRSRTRTNPAEAKTVAAAAIEHARKQLKLKKEERETLGVAAFSVAQMDAILRQLELLRRQHPECEEFFATESYEPFFVKNLENVQGDERDVIYISVGYGRTGEGYLAMSFGPLNRIGGERRLNVLISRARKRCEVFTTLSADDIDESKTASAGAYALKTFLAYAQTGKLDVAVQTGRAQDSEFEEQVCAALTRLGHKVHTQVGSAGFFLDLAIVDPERPGRYLLGIECDGAAYHSARSARDRDRLRQAVLEGLGWKIYRIWSTDWYRNPEGEMRKLRAAIESAGKGSGPRRPERPEPLAVLPAAPPERVEPAKPAVQKYRVAQVPIRLGGLEMHLVDRFQLAGFLAKVVEVEGPVHWTEAAKRVLAGAGVQRFGSRIQDAFRQAVLAGARARQFETRGEFLWPVGMETPPVRDRGELPGAAKKIHLITPEEIRAAILLAVETSFGIAPEAIAGTACELLGFAKLSEEMRGAVEKERDYLTGQGRLVLKGESLVIN